MIIKAKFVLTSDSAPCPNVFILKSFEAPCSLLPLFQSAITKLAVYSSLRIKGSRKKFLVFELSGTWLDFHIVFHRPLTNSVLRLRRYLVTSYVNQASNV